MTCDHANHLVIVTRSHRNSEPWICWCPDCGALKVAEVNIDRWIPARQPKLSPAVLVDLSYQKRLLS